ncbi:MAG: hypothetical protein EOM18_14760 [Clostridia bacterium]|nr:hypothetical protein [Clostridia bacterium]
MRQLTNHYYHLHRFHQEVDRLFDDAFRGFGLGDGLKTNLWPAAEQSLFKPRLDLGATEDAYSVSVEIPGVEEKDIRVACIDEDSSAPFGTMFLHAKQDEKQIAEKTMDILLREIEGKLVEEEDVLITGLLFRERRRSSKKQ